MPITKPVYASQQVLCETSSIGGNHATLASFAGLQSNHTFTKG
uniref:Uncharacterized protein n=1 Tax=Rhizophora mucronata TaxID=61149 RepID=A0A2P2R466_RHIMU